MPAQAEQCQAVLPVQADKAAQARYAVIVTPEDLWGRTAPQPLF